MLLAKEQLSGLLNDLQQGKRFAVFLFFGDEYLINEAASGLVNVLHPDEQQLAGLIIVDGDREDLADTIEELNSFALFGSAKAIWVKNSRVFHSRITAKDLLKSAHKFDADGDRIEAARCIGRMLGSLGWNTDDIQAGRLTTLAEKQWQSTLGIKKTSNEIQWIDELVRFMLEAGIDATAPQNSKALEEAIDAGFAGRNILILTCQTVDRRSTLFNRIKEKGVVVDLSLEGESSRQTQQLRQEQVLKQIDNLLKKEKKDLHQEARTLFLARTGYDFRIINQELKKLVCFVGERKLIVRSDVEEVVDLTREEAVYEIMNAVGERDAARCLLLFRRLLDQEIHIMAIHSLLVRKIRQLLWAKGFMYKHNYSKQPGGPDLTFASFQKNLYKEMDDIDRKILGAMAPWAVYKLLQHAGQFRVNELAGAMESLLEADAKLKSGILEPVQMVEAILVQMCLGAEGNDLFHKKSLME
jgi:DNA polymerase III subunit delta